MDIEGAELAALKGGTETILVHNPILIICLYHKPEDIWKIPLYIKSIEPNYKFYIRNHDGYKDLLELHAVFEKD